MRRGMKRFLSIMLTGMMCISLLTGCGAGSKTSEEAADTTAAKDNKAAETTDGATAETADTAVEGPSWKRDTTPITVDWFVAYDWYGKVFDPVNNLADQTLQTETGITINIITGDTDKLNALIMADELPDIVTFDAVASQRTQLEDAGMVLDLEGLANQYAPDLNIPQSQKDWYRNEDGKWYSAISYYYGPERCNDEFGGFLVTHNNNYVRTDLLAQLGLTMDDLKTKDGLYNALKAVKDQKLQYNGMDVIPITGVFAANMAEQLGIQLEDENGNLLSAYYQPEYLEALLFYNKLYREGLITSDEFTQDTTTRDQKVASGQVFFAQGWMTVKQPRQALLSADANAKFLYAGQLTGGDNGKTPYMNSVNSAGWTTTMITKNAENPDRIISLFAYLTQESVTLDEEYGYGCYDIVDGKVVRHQDAVDEYAADYNAAYNKYNMNLGYLVDYTINEKYENTDVDNVLEADRIAMERDENVNIYDNKCFTDVEPVSGTDLAGISAQIADYWKTVEPQMIMAESEEECKNVYQEALAQLDALGMQQLMEFRNERFQKNKEKLGLKFAWPTLQN